MTERNATEKALTFQVFTGQLFALANNAVLIAGRSKEIAFRRSCSAARDRFLPPNGRAMSSFAGFSFAVRVSFV